MGLTVDTTVPRREIVEKQTTQKSKHHKLEVSKLNSQKIYLLRIPNFANSSPLTPRPNYKSIISPAYRTYLDSTLRGKNSAAACNFSVSAVLAVAARPVPSYLACNSTLTPAVHFQLIAVVLSSFNLQP
jgi:hypothetical protein